MKGWGQKLDGAVVEEEGLTLLGFEPEASNAAAGNCGNGFNPTGLTVAPAWLKAKPLPAGGVAIWPRSCGMGRNRSKSGMLLPSQKDWGL